MTQSQIEDRARNKAFSQVTQLQLNIRRTKEDIKLRNIGGITVEQLEMILKSEQRELKTWQYISELIEKNI
jgi:hypothetical protein|tara:strand:- start:990 stop:1202 length:213 start_codon:yes stop_codon:yes gene_type:complete